MKSYVYTVSMEVTLPAFNEYDGKEAVIVALEDIDALGATVTKLEVNYSGTVN